MVSTRKAFSLVEMMAALVIFGISVVAGLEAITVCLRSTDNARNYTRASLLAQGLMEEALSETEILLGETSEVFDVPFEEFAWTRDIAETDTLRLYSVRVEVAWVDRGKQRSYELVTLRAER